jgi:hypothetical protein
MKAFTAPTAFIPPAGVTGRITAQCGRLGLMNSHGTGKIKFVLRSGFAALLKFGNVNPLVGSVNGAIGGWTPLPGWQKPSHQSDREVVHTSVKS